MFDIYILIDIHILIAFICFTEGFIFLAQIFEEKIGMELKLVCCFTLIKIEIISTLLIKSIVHCNKSRRYFSNDYLTQSLMKFHSTKSLAKTQGSVYVRSNQQMIFNYFIYKQVKMN